VNDVAKTAATTEDAARPPAAAPTSVAPVPAAGTRERSPDEPPTLRDLGLLKSLVPYLRPQWPMLVFSMCLVPISSLATLLQPYLVKHTLDSVLVQHSETAWANAITWFTVALFVEFIVGFGETYAMQLAGQRSMADLRRDVFRHAQRMTIGYYDRTPIGRVLTRVTNDVDSLGEIFSSGAVMAVADIVTLLGVIGFMLALDYRLSLITFIALPPLGIAVEMIRRRAREAFRDIRARISELNSYLSEQVQGVQIVQAYGREAPSADEYRTINDEHRQANYRSIRLDALLYSVVESVSMICVALVLWYASVRAGLVQSSAKQAAYIGTVVAFYQYIQRFFVPIRDLSTKYTVIQSGMAAAERVFGFLANQTVEPLDAFDDSAPTAAVTPTTQQTEALRFSHVSFGYRPDDLVLKDVSWSARAGEHVAIVGATGAGKTTTISLLLRLYEHTAGEILVDGQDIRTLPRRKLRQLFSLVPQDVFLFAGTIAQNVAFSPTQVDETKVRHVLSRVGALDLVERRPGGIHARVEERGSNWSAGERQLVAFARALYRDAPFLVLDEATANIDSETEARLQAAVVELMRGRTAIVIAHRLSTIRQADRILVFHRGQLAEQGTHEQLLQQGQLYAHLHRLQFGAE
jgi:ATP-binding cassette subfamily B protein